MDTNPLDEASWLSYVYADLSAISLTGSSLLYPWHGRKETYPYPDHIRGILKENYEVDTAKLNEQLQRLEPYVNV